MPRKPSVRYWKSRGAYMAWIKGKQELLARGPDDGPGGPCYREAAERFAELLAVENAGAAGDANTVRVVCDLYLQQARQDGRAAETLRSRVRLLGRFIAAGYGETPVAELTPFHVQSFLGAVRTKDKNPWGPGTVRTFLAGLNAAMRWAVRAELISRNPVAAVPLPSVRSRGRASLISDRDVGRLLDAASPPLRRVLVALLNTGARPGEILKATAAAWDDELGALVYHPEQTRLEGEVAHKTSRRRNKVRVIRFTGDALDMVRGLVATHPTGPLFRTLFGGAWTGSELAKRFGRLRKRLGLPRAALPYSFRHVFATKWLEAGGSIEVLAELLGNSPAVIRGHYAHLCERRPELRAELERFNAGRTATPDRPAG
jgi:integrase